MYKFPSFIEKSVSFKEKIHMIYDRDIRQWQTFSFQSIHLCSCRNDTIEH